MMTNKLLDPSEPQSTATWALCSSQAVRTLVTSAPSTRVDAKADGKTESESLPEVENRDP